MVSNLVLRSASAVILAPVVLGAIWFGAPLYEIFGIPLYTILLALFGAGLAWEWDQMFFKKNTLVGLWLAVLAVMTAFLTQDHPLVALWVLMLGALAVYFKSGGKLSMGLGTMYIGLPILSLSYIYYLNDQIARELVLWLLFVVWATDIGGYVVGCSLKGPKIAPKISAKKTWSGFFGGVTFAGVVAYVFALVLKAYEYINAEEFMRITCLMVGSAVILSVVSQIGDFFESAIKRHLNLKDSSNLIPGHGGLFDRVDGLLFASVLLAVVLFFVNQGWFFE